MSRPVFVGWLDAVEADGERVEVAGCAVGVDPAIGICLAESRRSLRAGRFLTAPKDAQWMECRRLWYFRERAGYEDDYWVHELGDCRVALATRRGSLPIASLDGPGVFVCKLPGEFLCG